MSKDILKEDNDSITVDMLENGWRSDKKVVSRREAKKLIARGEALPERNKVMTYFENGEKKTTTADKVAANFFSKGLISSDSLTWRNQNINTETKGTEKVAEVKKTAAKKKSAPAKKDES